MKEELNGAYVTGYTYTIDGSAVDEQAFNELLERISDARTYNGSIYQDMEGMSAYAYDEQDLVDAMNATRAHMGMMPIS